MNHGHEGKPMAIEQSDIPTVGPTKDEILAALLPHRPRFGSEWAEIDPTKDPLPPIHYYEENWPNDLLSSLKYQEQIYPPQDFVLIVNEVADQSYHYSILPFRRKK
jgi:hypothetical protein